MTVVARIDDVFRNSGGKKPRPRPRPTPPAFSVTISFASSLSGSAAGLTATATGSTDADESFQFDARADPGGVPLTMVLNLSAADVCSVDFPGDYSGDACRYVSKAGAIYNTTFQSGTVNL